jgi:hypothetical protein
VTHDEIRAACAEVIATRHVDSAGADSHRSRVCLALAAVVPALLDELEGLRAADRPSPPAPFGNALVVGELEIVEEGKRHTVRRAILVQFETQDEAREAIERRALAFGLFGETREEVEAR